MKAQASPAAQLRGFLAKYTPAVASEGRAVLAWMRTRLPGAVELVYDNYNFLAIGFGPTARASEAVFSVVLAPRWVSLSVVHGAKLKDPQKLLRGVGKQVRNIRLEGVKTLKRPAVRALIDQAIARSTVPFNRTAKRRMEIRAALARHRPRRP